mgnify:CR=1 FL=1
MPAARSPPLSGGEGEGEGDGEGEGWEGGWGEGEGGGWGDGEGGGVGGVVGQPGLQVTALGQSHPLVLGL